MKELIVDKNSSINSISKAIELSKNNEHTNIIIKKGIYHEKITIDKDNITLIGESTDGVIIEFNDCSKKIHEDGRDYNTFRTATFSVCGNFCSIINLTIKNNCLSKVGGQAIALEVYGDCFKASNCKIISEQDTLLLGPIPDDLKERYINFLNQEKLFKQGSLFSKFNNCLIEGNIDFIFGCGSSLFEDCSLVSNGNGYVVAPSHSMFQDYGFVFLNCKFLRKENNINNVYIARPWRAFGYVSLINCFFDKHIKNEGYTSWNNPHPEIYNRFFEYPLTNNRVYWVNTYSNSEYIQFLNKIKKQFNF